MNAKKKVPLENGATTEVEQKGNGKNGTEKDKRGKTRGETTKETENKDKQNKNGNLIFTHIRQNTNMPKHLPPAEARKPWRFFSSWASVSPRPPTGPFLLPTPSVNLKLPTPLIPIKRKARADVTKWQKEQNKNKKDGDRRRKRLQRKGSARSTQKRKRDTPSLLPILPLSQPEPPSRLPPNGDLDPLIREMLRDICRFLHSGPILCSVRREGLRDDGRSLRCAL